VAEIAVENPSKPKQAALSKWWYVGVAVALAVASLISTAHPVFDPAVQAFYAVNADSELIAENAMAAGWSDIGRWWSGPWIQHEMYYRPLASMLFFAEGQLFRSNFQSYCIVSWLANAANVVLLFLLGASLARGSRKVKLVIGALTAALFLLAKHPELFQGVGNPTAPEGRITSGVMPWWPVQTDLFSMLCGVLSLLLLDRYLLNRRRGYLVGALGSFVAALLFKEMALCLPLMVPLLVLYRRRQAVLGISAAYFALGFAFFVVRSLAAPGASGLEYQGMQSLRNYAYYVVHDLYMLTYLPPDASAPREWFPVLGALGLLVIVLVMTRKRIEWLWAGLAVLLWLVVSGQLFGGSFAMFTVAGPMLKLGTMLVFWGGLAVLVLVRDRGVSVALVVAMLAAFVPVINRMGPHYWYWPLAFYALLNASLLNRLYEVSLQSDEFSLIVSRSPSSSE